MAIIAANDTDQPSPPAESVDPQLLMAARCGDSKRLKELLRLKKDDNEEEHPHGLAEAITSSEVVIVEVVPRRPAPAPAAAAPTPPGAPPSAPALLPSFDGVTLEGDTPLHVVAASGDGDEFLDCAKMIVRDKKRKGGAAAMRGALEARNRKGDTPLHCAAGAGNAKMIFCLVDLASTDEASATVVEFLRMQNKYRETALHQAIRAAKNKQRACIDQLMDVDTELASIPHEEGPSPLYTAISLGEVDIAQYLFRKSEGKLSYCGPDGRNVLHAAVSLGQQAMSMVLKWLKEEKTVIMQEGQKDQEADLLLRLTSERDKKNGSTPLHLAASLGGWTAFVIFSLPWLRRVWTWSDSSTKTMLQLLDANVSMLYQPDNEGLYPIHVAALAGSWRNVLALLEKYPECATLRDGEGRTFLHAAVEKERYYVVCDICINRERFSSILNVQDNNGDTALHRAVHAANFAIVYSLICTGQVRLDVPNNEGMRPIDLTWSEMPFKIYYAWDPRIRIRKLLLQVQAPYGQIRADVLYENVHPKGKDDNDEVVSKNLTDAAQVLGIVSVLVTTAAFASTFTVPGGYRSAGDGGGVAGTPVLAGSYAFDAFILSDALAFICSFTATVVLAFAGVPGGHLSTRFWSINTAYSLMLNSGRSLLAAFGLGLYVVLLLVARTIPIAVAVIICMMMQTGITEGIISTAAPHFIFARSQKLTPWEAMIGWILFVLGHFWSFILIFGLPAIRKWPRLR